eukprot:CAMPEP_0202965960 /NCGR_PEP_ID=MMETSP1396-20130829/10152_1 /ASSEMBLY_ACC=CAM_ASM_000872 /TAXON_ID= /ORGANISM="Pseudokeronopsis sp., Strain Brazil" /LENGTH=58 /DNA_ID=CAMNT_0049689249 /DNA_START=258 /DNA_END=434 /DNA_ORIENTATION=-
MEGLARQNIFERENLQAEKAELDLKLAQINSHLQFMMQENIQLKKKCVYLERTSKEQE